MTCIAAAEAGIPAIIAEAGGCGLLDEAAVQLLVRGVENVLRSLGMLPGEPEPAAGQRHVARSEWLRCSVEGWWDADVGRATRFRPAASSAACATCGARCWRRCTPPRTALSSSSRRARQSPPAAC